MTGSRVIGGPFLLELWEFARSSYRVTRAGDGAKVETGRELHFGAKAHIANKLRNGYFTEENGEIPTFPTWS